MPTLSETSSSSNSSSSEDEAEDSKQQKNFHTENLERNAPQNLIQSDPNLDADSKDMSVGAHSDTR